jgi:hypothetical protein
MPTVCTLTGKFVDGTGLARTGRVTFVPTVRGASPADDLILSLGTVVRVLDASGSFSVDLYRTDDASWTPTGWVWTVLEDMVGATGVTYAIELTSATANLADLSPAVVTNPVTSYVSQATYDVHEAASTGVHGITGTVGVGKVLATNSAGTAPLWQSKDVFDVRDYGAVGDGVTDDTTAIQAAFTAAGVSGGVVTMPPGTFLVGSEIVIPDLCSLEGAGRWTTIIRLTSSGATVSWGPVTAGTDTPIRLPGYLAHFQIDGQGIADVCLTIGALASPTGWNVELRDAAVDCLRLNQVQNGEFFRWQTSEAVRYCINFDYGANGNNFFGAYVTKAETALVNFGGAVPSGIGSANGPGRNVFWGSYLERPEAAMTSLVRAESGRQNSFVDTRINADVPTTLDPLPLVDIVAAGAAGTVQQLTFTRCRFAGNGTTDVYPLKQVSGTPVAFDRCVFASTLDTATVWMQTTVDVWMFANNFETSPTTMHTTGDEKILAVPGSVGRVMLPDGTVSNPALAFGSDPTVGHQLFATGVLALVAAGKVWRVDGTNGGRLINTGFGTATTQAMVQRVTGDTQDRFARLANGQMRWGPGDAAADVTMERISSGTLGVGAGHSIRTGRAATGSRPSASTVGSGAMFYDTTLSKPIWSDGAAWRDATGTSV